MLPGDDGIPWRTFLAEAERRFADAGLASAEVDARRIVERASGFEGAELALGLREPATQRGVHFFDVMVERRLAGEPLQYVLGEWSFRTLDLFVDPRVLIPRPETEQVVEHALIELDRLHAARDGAPLTVVDLGTGSGAIALSVAAERPGVDVWATDASTEALDVMRANLAGVGRAGRRVRVAEGSWFDALPGDLRGTIDLVISNPPYVAESDELPAEVLEHEPRAALIPGPTGREALDHLVAEAPAWLVPDGVLVLELAPDQAAGVAALASANGFASVSIAPDLTGRDRMVIARLS